MNIKLNDYSVRKKIIEDGVYVTKITPDEFQNNNPEAMNVKNQRFMHEVEYVKGRGF